MQHNTFEEKLAALRSKRPSEISEADRAELKALRSYLLPHEMTAFGIEEDPEAKAEVNEGAEAKPEAPRASKGLTKVQLQEALTAKGIEFPPDATKVKLQALLDGVNEDEEDVKPEGEEE